MIRGLRFEMILTYSQTINGYGTGRHALMIAALATIELNGRGLLSSGGGGLRLDIGVPSGPSFGKQNWCCGMNQTQCYGAQINDASQIP